MFSTIGLLTVWILVGLFVSIKKDHNVTMMATILTMFGYIAKSFIWPLWVWQMWKAGGAANTAAQRSAAAAASTTTN